MQEIFNKRLGSLLLGFVAISLVGCSESEDVGAGSETAALSVRVVEPVEGAAVSDLVTIVAEATDDKGIAYVEFFVDARLIAVDPAPPYETGWNASSEGHGTAHSIYAVVYDTDENKSGSVNVTCSVDTSLNTPLVVTLLNPLAITDSSVNLVWDMNLENDFKYYRILWDTSGAGEVNLSSRTISEAIDTAIVISGLRDNVNYRFQIVVEDIFGRTSLSNVVLAKTENRPPSQPILYSVNSINGTVSFHWSHAGIWDFDRYEIIRSVDSIYDSGDLPIATILEIDTTAFEYSTTDTVMYFYFIQLFDNTGLSSVSEPFGSQSIRANFALQFDGSSYATIPYFTELDVGGSYTLEAWVNMTAASTYMRVIDKSPPGSPHLQYSLICDPKLGADVCNGGSPARYHSSASVPLNEWHHVALTYQNGFISYYIDGLPAGTTNASISSVCSFATTLNIGRRKLYDEFYFRGMIDEVRVWSDVRSSGEILASHNVHLTGLELGLVCYYDFDEGSDQAIISPVGGSGYLGESSDVDAKDPVWVASTAPVAY